MNIEKWLKTDFDKKNDWVLVTGASSGIGLEYMKAFAKLGCNVLSVCNQRERNVELSRSTADECGVRIEPIYANLSSQDEVDLLIGKLGAFSVKILVSNAGFGIKGNFEKVESAKYKDIIGLHVAAPTFLTQSVLNNMRKTDKGLIIIVSSINVASPIPGNTVYTATKFYQYSFAMALAHENSRSKIKFQTLLPGTTDTPFHQRQGAVPKSLVMRADEVVRRSLANIDQKVCIPNNVDKLTFPVLSRLPIWSRMSTAKYLIRRRLSF